MRCCALGGSVGAGTTSSYSLSCALVGSTGEGRIDQDVKKEHMIDEKVEWEWASVEGQEGSVWMSMMEVLIHYTHPPLPPLPQEGSW